MVNVLKANGELEPFSEEKLRYSIERAGIPSALQDKVVSHVKSKLHENIPTSVVYKHISEFLAKEPNHFSAKYSLKQAIMNLGPTGHPFEDLLSELFKKEGFTTQTRTVLSGKCVSHEIDVIAEKNDEKIMVEAKFHNRTGTRTEIHVSLYTKARFDDIKEKYGLTKAILATNTKVTADALSYALCSNMEVISWSYPEKRGLRDLIEIYNLHPITVLTSLSQNQKMLLLEEHIVLCKEIANNPSVLDLIDILPAKKKNVMDELSGILNL